VVGVDDSPGTRAALRLAAPLARLTDASLVLVHVFGPRQPAIGSGARGCVNSYREDVTRAEVVLRQARRQAMDVVAQSELRFGEPSSVLCERARELGASLVIVGSRRLGTIDRQLLGSVSHGVLARAPCSVLVAMAP
jgi:nucleotide-binding universal stress UspA family protein